MSDTAMTPAEEHDSYSRPENHLRRGSALSDFLRGAALIFDFTGSLSRNRISTMRYPTDADALAADWDAVGADLHRAMGLHLPDPPAR